MTLAHICIALAIASPYVFTSIAKFAGGDFGQQENRNPRDWLARLDGYRKRAHFAQQNSFEIVPAFAVAVLVAQQIGKLEQPLIDSLAIAFLISRTAYGVCYLADWPTLRSLTWFTGLICIATLFVFSA